MPRPPTIARRPDRKKSTDFAFLREQGLQYIQELAGETWTDHNTHDPGITLLEALSFALTDLGYRANLDMADLLPPEEPDEKTTSFSPEGILSCNPVKPEDLRKMILGYRHSDVHPRPIRNAWVNASEVAEQPIFWDAARLAYDAKKGVRIKPEGLYDIQLEFNEYKDSESGEYLDLNGTIIKDVNLQESLPGIGKMYIEKADDGSLDERPFEIDAVYQIMITFPYWDEVDPAFREPLDIKRIEVQNYSLKGIENMAIQADTIAELPEDRFEVADPEPGIVFLEEKDNDGAYITLNIIYNQDNQEKVLPDFRIFVRILNPVSNNDILIPALVNQLEQSNAEVELYNKKVIAVYEILNGLKDHLHQYRNVGEDFVRFKTVRVQEIAVHADIELAPQADPNDLLANLYYRIERFFNPSIHFYQLEELLEEGYEMSDIFEGPVLANGFIKTEELSALKRKNVIYVSDLMRAMLEGQEDQIIATKDIRLTNFILNRLINWRVKDCLFLPVHEEYIPMLSIERSGIRLFHEGEVLQVDEDNVKEILKSLKEQELSQQVIPNTTLPTPSNGKANDAGSYYSFQNLLPAVYGIGEHGLAKTASDSRVAKARQLKAYLTFFDQLLANGAAQLANIENLFSLDEEIRQTRFAEVPETVRHIKDIYVDADGMRTAFQGPDDASANEIWTDLIETEEDFKQRRNHFLDHLAARFGEQFPTETLPLSRLIPSKLKFLQHYPALSSGRGHGFHYYQKKENGQPDVWDTDNVGGLKKRICALLGIKDCNRRFLSPSKLRLQVTPEKGDQDKLRFSITDQQGKILLSSSKGYPEDDLIAGIQEVLEKGSQSEHFKLTLGKYKVRSYLKLTDEADKSIARHPRPLTSGEAGKAEVLRLARDLGVFQKATGEGFYLLEHILLRPRIAQAEKPSSILFIPEKVLNNPAPDPFSFQLSFFFPKGSPGSRFANPAFRRAAEKLIQEEVPAYVLPYIFWLSPEELGYFERFYEDWLNAQALQLDLKKIDVKRRILVRFMNELFLKYSP